MDIKIIKDGDEFCAYDADCFINLQESLVGFGETKEEALINYIKIIQEFNPIKEFLKQRLSLQKSLVSCISYGKEQNYSSIERILLNMDKELGKIINLEDHRPHKTNSVICLSCLKDWQAVYPENVNINNLECPNCKEHNSIEFNLITARKIINFLKNNDQCLFAGNIIDCCKDKFKKEIKND